MRRPRTAPIRRKRLQFSQREPLPPGEPRRLITGTTNATSSANSYYVAVAKLLDSKILTISITAVESGASVENARRIEKGEYDLALVTADTQYQSYHGLAAFKDTANKELRGLWIRTFIPNAMVMREDSGVKLIEDLNGHEFNPGMCGSSTENAHRRAFEVLGIQPKWYQERRVQGLRSFTAFRTTLETLRKTLTAFSLNGRS